MKFLFLVTCVAFAGVLAGCVSGNDKLQAQYDRGQSDAVKELYWAKERAKADTNAAPEAQEYLEVPAQQDPNAPIKQMPHTVVLPVLASHPN